MKEDPILIIPDLHTPYEHPDAFKFIDAISEKYKTRRTICLGDEVDNHCISFHDKDPDLPFSASKELEAAIWHLKDLYVMFPHMVILESNHGSLVYRKQKYCGLPKAVFKEYRDILQAPKNWSWKFDHIEKSGGKDIYFHHGLNKRAEIVSKHKSMNVVQGHYHSMFGVFHWANAIDTYWGVNAGCLIDTDALAFTYAKSNLPQPILGTIVISGGNPILIPMGLDRRKRWNGRLI